MAPGLSAVVFGGLVVLLLFIVLSFPFNCNVLLVGPFLPPELEPGGPLSESAPPAGKAQGPSTRLPGSSLVALDLQRRRPE